MWKQWTNFVLAIIVVFMAAYGAPVALVVLGATFIAVLALWEAIDGMPVRKNFMRHAH